MSEHDHDHHGSPSTGRGGDVAAAQAASAGGDATAFWEELYTQRDRIWSGRANAALVDVIEGRAPGTALDLGSGEGGDSIWLAEQGWSVTGLDISPTALARAAEHATERGVPAGRIHWQLADLAEWRPGVDERYDLVSACFLHSPVEFPREEVLRRAADTVAPGGLLLVVGHAAFPPWSTVPEHERPELPAAEEVRRQLDLPEPEWTVLISESRPRAATGPDGQAATIDDAVLLLQRA